MIRALIVDDDEAARVGVEDALIDEGFRVETAESAEECERMLARSQDDHDAFDVIVLDLRMPGRDGDEILPALRRRYPFTAIVIVTAFAKVETAVNTMWHGAYQYLGKPCDPRKDLVPALRAGTAHFRLKRIQQQLFNQPHLTRWYSEISSTLKDLVSSESHFFLFLAAVDSPGSLRIEYTCDQEGRHASGGQSLDSTSRLVKEVYGEQKFVHVDLPEEVAAFSPLVKETKSLIAAPIPGFDGKVEGLLALESDQRRAFDEYIEDVLQTLANLVGLACGIQRLLKVEMELQAIRKSSRDLVSSARMMAHHIRNPLHVLRSSLDLIGPHCLEDPMWSRDELTKHIERDRRLCGEIEDVVDQLFSMGTPATPTALSEVDLNELLQARSGNYETLAERAGVRFSLRVADQPACVKADKRLLVRAFDVVVENAVEACVAIDGNQRDPLVTMCVCVREKDRSVRVTVNDTGPGIDADHAERIFEPAFSTRGSQWRRGAGLFTARNIVVEHRGRIHVDQSRPVGSGASFVIDIPLDTASRRGFKECEVADVHVG